jgi:retinitis pigmentosa 9 protein
VIGKFNKEGEDDDEKEEPPEESIPDLPENQKARQFLKNAPSKGLFMPLGVQVKVMQCWRCKEYGHRAGDAI